MSMKALPTIFQECCTPLTAARLSDEEVSAAAGVLKALADPARIRIVNLLAGADGAICVCDLTGPLGLSQPTVSHHLKKLTAVGLLQREQRGTWAYYTLERDALRRVASLLEVPE
jgi:ArsR family transcriptional regulator, arsenate/arsenite/antimonite-responsive transcriptional repressor